MSDILLKQTQIIRELFKDNSITVTRATSASDVNGWDSMMHIQIIAEIEKSFGVRFALGELQSLKNVGDMEDLIKEKTNAV